MWKKSNNLNESGQRTLLNYFLKSPTNSNEKREQLFVKEGLNKSQDKHVVDESDEDVVLSQRTKRCHKVFDSDDEMEAKLKSVEQESKRIKVDSHSSIMQSNIHTESKKTVLINEKKIKNTVCNNSFEVIWPHKKLEFLRPDKIRDKKGRSPYHPDYDKSTLYIPQGFLGSLSPAVRQWWHLKSDNFDCILFFKVGKFYELYHMDADIGVNELGFTYMRGEFAHAGFPEVSFYKMASVLIDRGYKVARVEQTETPDMMTERCRRIKANKFDKVVRREICQITNKGTQVFGTQCQITSNFQNNYMLAIIENNKGTTSEFGICFIDTSIGDFYIGQFKDDKNCSRLLMLLSHHMPVLVLAEKRTLSERVQQIFRDVLGGVLKELFSTVESQMYTAENTLKMLAEKYYGSDDSWPMILRITQDTNDHLGLTPNESYKLALKALGVCIMYLRKCLLEEKVITMAHYHLYLPPDMNTEKVKIEQSQMKRKYMVLDSTTLSNLRITGEYHSLITTLDYCCTKFGKRLLHFWICSPSCNLSIIIDRQLAIKELLEHEDILQEMRALLSQMPDFERHLAQIHLFGNKRIVDEHPDGRAILFEEKLYNKKKIQNFIAILKGFEALTNIPTLFKYCTSSLIRRLTQLPMNEGIYPDIKGILPFFKNAFDHSKAEETGIIAPEQGVDSDYDESELKITKVNEELKDYLVEQEKFFGCHLSYFGSDKNRFQLEVPENNAHRANKEYSLEGKKKGAKPCRRYTTKETKNFLKQMQKAEEERDNVLKDISRRIFEKFSNHYTTWKRCVDCVSKLDVLSSLAEYARNQNVICVPELCDTGRDSKPFINIEKGFHPCMTAETFMPNGIVLGESNTAPLAILTGPNMGGKSTLMRQIGLLVVMAHIGAHVPAQSCKLSIVDRIFTRLGAQDDIIAGQSTFLVELNETSLILKHATINSLVLLDELGRGTSTYDGTAIAASVVDFLANKKCPTLFSTHYYNLIDFFHKDIRVALGHMSCMVENESIDDPIQENVTFLYKYSVGACPKSYGFNAAKLAGMPHCIIKRAYDLSRLVEAIALKRKIAARMFTGITTSSAAIKDLLLKLKMCY